MKNISLKKKYLKIAIKKGLAGLTCFTTIALDQLAKTNHLAIHTVITDYGRKQDQHLQ
jgi:hypothetical protein